MQTLKRTQSGYERMNGRTHKGTGGLLELLSQLKTHLIQPEDSLEPSEENKLSWRMNLHGKYPFMEDNL